MPNLRPNELGEIASKLAALETDAAEDEDATETGVPDEIIESTVTKYLEENAAELAAEKDKPFEPMGRCTKTRVAKPLTERGDSKLPMSGGESQRGCAKSGGGGGRSCAQRSTPFPLMRKGATARCRRFPSSTSRAGSRWRCAAARRTGRF
jgi:hypothetical protein